MAAIASNTSNQLKLICKARVKLCQVALMRDGDTRCIFAGGVVAGQKGHELAVSLGQNGFVVTCEIFANHELSIGPLQRHTTLLHILCQSRLQLLQFLFNKMKKRSSLYAKAVRLTEQENVGEVVKIIMTSFPELYNVLDHAEMTPLSRLIQSISRPDCLLNWLSVFDTLVQVKVKQEPSQVDQFIRAVIDKLCLVEYRTRFCASECTCEKEIFKTLLRVNRDMKTYAFRSAARRGNFHLMDMFLKQHYANNTYSFVTPHVVSEKGEPNIPEPIIVYILKSESCRRRMSEDQLVYLLDQLAEHNRIDINEADVDGFNAVFYAAKFHLRKPFYLLLNHSKFNVDWRNSDGESLEDLFCWSGLDHINHAATVALRRKTKHRISEADTFPRRLVSSTGDSTFTEDFNPTLEQPHSQIATEIFQKKIESNFVRLCRDMDPDGALLDVLVQHKVLSSSKLDAIASEKTRHAKVRRVLTLVIRAGKRGRLAFLHGLRYSDQEHLFDLLKSTSIQSLDGSVLDLSGADGSVDDGKDEVATNPSLPVSEGMSFEVNTIYSNYARSHVNADAVSDLDLSRPESSVNDGIGEVATNPSLPVSEWMSFEVNSIHSNYARSHLNADAVSDLDLSRLEGSVNDGRDVEVNPTLPADEEMSFELNRIHANNNSSPEHDDEISDIQNSFSSDSFEDCDSKVIVKI